MHVEGGITNLWLERNAQTLKIDANYGNGGDQSLTASAGLRMYTGGANERLRLTSDGYLLAGHSTRDANIASGTAGRMQLWGTSWANAGLALINTQAATDPAFLSFAKSRKAAPGDAAAVVQNGDRLGEIRFAGDDGTDMHSYGASIAVYVDGTPGSNDMPGKLVFATTADGDANSTTRLEINSSGAIGIAGAYGTTGQVIKSAGGAAAPAWGDSTIGISSGGLSIGSPTTLNFIGAGNTFAMNGSTVDISISGGGGGSGDFNTGLTGEFHGTAVGIGSTVFTFPSTAGKKYILRSLLATNVATANTDVNVIGAIDFNGGERSYIGYNLPVPVGMAAELLRQPQVLNPSDSILLRSTDIDRNGADSVIEYYGTYELVGSGAADYAGVGLGANTLSGTTATTLYTSTGAASVLQSIRVANITDSGAKPVSVSVVDGGETIRFVENLIVPKYGSIEILDNQKRIASGAIIKVTLDEGGSMGVQLSAKKIAAV